jgi:hypothetical protein
VQARSHKLDAVGEEMTVLMKRTMYVKTIIAVLAIGMAGLASVTLSGVAGAKAAHDGAHGFRGCITMTGSSFSATAGVSVSPTVATFTDTRPPWYQPPWYPSQFSATIDWGDGTTTSGTVSPPAGYGDPYTVTGTHTYATQGTYTTHITVFQGWPGYDKATATGTATVNDYSIDATGVPIPDQVTGQALDNVPVATFTDANPNAPLGEFTAVIDWGDGSATTDGSITQPSGVGTTFDVAGGHTYSTAATFTVTVTISDIGGASAVVTEPVSVSNAGSTITCSSGGCSGSISTPLQTDAIHTSSSTGSITASINSDSLLCGDDYRHAPQVTTINGTGLSPNKPILETVSFPRSELVGPAGDPVEVCYESSADAPFIDLEGQSVTQGLLPLCGALMHVPPQMRLGPCIKLQQPISVLHTTIVEKLVVPPNDPRHM